MSEAGKEFQRSAYEILRPVEKVRFEAVAMQLEPELERTVAAAAEQQDWKAGRRPSFGSRLSISGQSRAGSRNMQGMLMKVNSKRLVDSVLTAKVTEDVFDERRLSWRPKHANSSGDHFRGRSWSDFVAAALVCDLATLGASVNWRPKCNIPQATKLYMPSMQVCLGSSRSTGIVQFDAITMTCFGWIAIARQSQLIPATTASDC